MSLPREDSSKILDEFFETLWHSEEGQVYLPTKESDGTWKKNFFAWPDNKKELPGWVLEQSAANKDVYCSPVIFNEPSGADKSNVKGSFTLWGDWDGEAPEWVGEGQERATDALPGVPPPSVRVQSSLDKREHLYWSLPEFNTDIEYIEQLNRRIAYSGNADTGCWNINRVLRPPGTINTGNGKDRKALPVTLLETNSGQVTRDNFSQLSTPRTLIKESIRDLETLPSLEEVYTGNEWSKELMTLFKAEGPKVGDRSKALVRLSMLSAELGFTEESIYVLVEDADRRWEKYTNRSQGERQRLLVNLVDRAKSKHPEALPDMVWSPEVNTDTRTTYGFKDLLKADLTIDWLMENLLPEKGIGIISAAPGVGKTLMSLDMSVNLALGKDYLVWPVKRKARVLYLSLEMGGPHFRNFQEKIATNLTEEELDELNEDFIIAPVGEMLHFKNKNVIDFLTTLFKKHEPDVVVIDSLSQVLAEMQDNQEVLTFFDKVTKFQNDYNLSFIFIHHNKKPAENKPSTLADVYGSVFITGSADFVLSLWRPNEEPEMIKAELVKARFAAAGDPFVLRKGEDLRYEIQDGEKLQSYYDSKKTSEPDPFKGGDLGLTGFQ